MAKNAMAEKFEKKKTSIEVHSWGTQFNKSEQSFALKKKKENNLERIKKKMKMSYLVQVPSHSGSLPKKNYATTKVIETKVTSCPNESDKTHLSETVSKEKEKLNKSSTLIRDFSKSDKLAHKISVLSQDSGSHTKCIYLRDSISDNWLKKCSSSEICFEKISLQKTGENMECVLNPLSKSNKLAKTGSIYYSVNPETSTESLQDQQINTSQIIDNKNLENHADVMKTSKKRYRDEEIDYSPESHTHLKKRKLTNNVTSTELVPKDKNAAERLKKSKNLKRKVASGTVNDNFVSINLRKKNFTKSKVNWKGKKKGSKSRTFFSNTNCFKCGNSGHWVKNCPQSAGGNNSSKKN